MDHGFPELVALLPCGPGPDMLDQGQPPVWQAVWQAGCLCGAVTRGGEEAAVAAARAGRSDEHLAEVT